MNGNYWIIIVRGFLIFYLIYLKKINCSNYSEFEKRFVGRISEILFNVWLEYKFETGKIRKSDVKELDYNVEENLCIKILAFLKAKFFGKKYESSF